MINIVKVGGGIIEDPAALSIFLNSFAALEGKKILVHGGGRLATKLAEQMGIETQMVEGRRITNDDMLNVVTMVYGGLANKTIVAQLQAQGVNAMGLSGADGNVIKAHKRTGTTIDYGWVGDVDDVDADLLMTLLNTGIVPVIAPLTHDGNGHMLNTNADTIASMVATAVAQKSKAQLVLGFELDGVLTDPKDKTSVISKIDPQLFEQYKAEGIITDGMIPKLSNAFDAINKGVASVKICNALKVGEAANSDAGTLIVG